MQKNGHSIDNQPAPGRSWIYGSYACLLAVLLLCGYIRLRFLDVPLERDEGEYAYAGQLMLKFIAPYRFCHTMKLPGTAAAYALIMAVFGQTPAAIHFGLLLVNSGTTVLMYFLAKRLFGPSAGVVAAASFALLSLEPSVLGLAAHATQFVVLPAMGGILLLLKAIEARRRSLTFASGWLLGLAFVMKQSGIFFALFAFFYLLYGLRAQSQSWRNIVTSAGVFLSAAVLPFAITCFILFAAGDFQSFWFWAYDYASAYATTISLSAVAQILWNVWPVVIPAVLRLLLIAIIGVTVLLWDPKTRTHGVFVIGFLLFSCAAVCPGLYFRKHYFILPLPAVSLLCAAAVSAGANLLGTLSANRRLAFVPGALFAFAFGVCLMDQSKFFFGTDPLVPYRDLYTTNPFTEAPVISAYLKSHSDEGDRIAVIGSEPEIYFYSERRSATGYIYMYPLMESQPFALQMQKEMITEIEAARPKFLVFVSTQLSWLASPRSDKTIIAWAQKYAHDNYRLAGVSDTLNGVPEYHWKDAGSYQPRSQYKIFVFERKTMN